jgi:hypothetical protein
MRVTLFLFVLSGCVFKHEPKMVQSPLRVPDPKKIITLICDEKCSEGERLRLAILETKLNETLGSQCFEDFITAKGRPYHMLNENPESVVKRMRTPQVILVNYFFHPAFGLAGFDVAEQPVIHMNRASIAAFGMDACAEASVMAHEIAHVKGFMHRGNENNEYNNSTVPYVINHAFDPKREDYRNGGCCL